MECDICLRAPDSKRPLLCPSCARSTVYETRIRSAQILLEKEQLGNRIHRVSGAAGLEDPKWTSGQDDQAKGAARKWSVESNNVKSTQVRERVKEVKQHVQVLRDEIDVARKEIAERKTAIRRQREQQKIVHQAVPPRRDINVAEASQSFQKKAQTWDALQAKAIETRSFLCREAAHLYGLRQKKKYRAGEVHEQYVIGGVPIYDLRNINNAKSTDLTTSLTNVARLVVLVAHYLSVRLPAEITLPHQNYPLPTIFTPANSYQGREIPFLGTTPTSSLSSSPISSRHPDQRPLPKPRPLYIEPENVKHKVPFVAKRDPNTYAYFLEGLCLLAWNVAWLCRSQGLNEGTETWEDVCNMGCNLWTLLIAPPPSPTLLRVMSDKAVPSLQSGPQRPARLGLFSHASAYTFPTRGGDFTRGWKVSKYTMIVDPLKRVLLGEMSNAEWELLEQEEWNDGAEPFREDEAVFIKDGRRVVADTGEAGPNFDGVSSVMTARNDVIGNSDAMERGGVDDTDAGDGTKGRGMSGWTKLKAREKP